MNVWIPKYVDQRSTHGSVRLNREIPPLRLKTLNEVNEKDEGRRIAPPHATASEVRQRRAMRRDSAFDARAHRRADPGTVVPGPGVETGVRCKDQLSSRKH